jgi:hypothetical protein
MGAEKRRKEGRREESREKRERRKRKGKKEKNKNWKRKRQDMVIEQINLPYSYLSRDLKLK